MKMIVKDIKPQTPIASLDRDRLLNCKDRFNPEDASQVLGMSLPFIRKVVGHSQSLNGRELLTLLDEDAFSETYVPRSKVLDWLQQNTRATTSKGPPIQEAGLFLGSATDLIPCLRPNSVQCVVTSTPYWGTRLYSDMQEVLWADGDVCAYGMEQTPEAFIRHSVQILAMIKPCLTSDSSVWWNIMDSFNTRTQIRNSAVEALRAMQGKDTKSWKDHDCRRYSAGHSYLKDGEQCLVPLKIAERASRIGYYLKTVISWTKSGSMPEPQNSRVSRNVEYILHLTLQRTPRFYKETYRTLPPKLGGRNTEKEPDRLSDFWYLPTSAGRDGHGAQFPLALPARCIALSSTQDELVLDPFVGSGTSAVAAKLLSRRFIGFDVSRKYLDTAEKRLKKIIDVQEGFMMQSAQPHSELQASFA